MKKPRKPLTCNLFVQVTIKVPGGYEEHNIKRSVVFPTVPKGAYVLGYQTHIVGKR